MGREKNGSNCTFQRGFDLPNQNIIDGNIPIVYSNGILKFHNQSKSKAPGLITGRSGTIGKFTFIEDGEYWPHNTSLWVTNFSGNIPKYIYYLYQTINIEQFSTGSGVPTLNRNDVHRKKCSIPSTAEQKKIAEFLSALDTKIQTQKKTITYLETLIKGVGQKLFTQKVRFKEFTDKWELKTLGEVLVEPKQIPVEKPNEIELLTVKLHCKGIENTGNYPATTKNGRPYYRRFKNEILIGRQNFHNGGIGIVKDENNGKICSNAISSYNVLKDNLLFVYFYISRTEYYKRVDDLIGGTGQKEISKSEFSKLKINLSSLEEQTKIADFLSKISEKLETEKKILELLEQQKKYFLQTLFI